MIASFTKKLLFSVLLITSLVNSSTLKAQMLEEVPNPTDFTLNFFSGGEDGNLFFEYQDFNFLTTLHHYDGIDLTPVPLPPDDIFSFYSHAYNDNYYIQSFDINFNAQLFEFDGLDAQPLAVPAGFTYSFFAANFEGNMYVGLNDINFNTSLFQYDGTNFFEIPSPADMQFNNYIATFDGLMYLSYFDATFNTHLFSFDGSTLNPVPGFPDISTFIFLAFEGEDQIYLGVQDAAFNTFLYEFDGTTFGEIPTPADQIFSFVVGENTDAGELYVSYFDNINFNTFLYTYDGTTLTPITPPAGFDFPNLANVLNGNTYLSFFDVNTFDGALFRLDGGTLVPITAPAGFSYSQFLGDVNGEGFYLYFDQNFDGVMMKLDEATNSLSTVPNPPGFTFSFFLTTVNNKILAVYNDPAFTQSLWFFDGTDFMQVDNPPNKFFSFFMTEDQDVIYLRYDDENDFTGTLYKLIPNSLPTSIDTSVTTFVNIPYFFSSTDFAFTDPDPNDEFSSILITDIEQVGFLLWDGAHVYVGDVIPFDEIENITFTPLTDELGSPYDAFKFKVGDGDAFSDQSYTMTINVLDPTSIDENELNAFTNVFPVPANTSATLTIESEKQLDEMYLRIFSTSGQLMDQKYYDGLGNNFQETIDVSSFPTGSYFIVGKTPIGQMVKQIIINR